jgi:signal transduction histidine kinase
MRVTAVPGAAVRWWRRHERALDVGTLAALTAVAALGPVVTSPLRDRTPAERAVLALVFFAPLVRRWQWPRTVFAFTVAATAALWSVSGSEFGYVVLPTAAYAMAVSVERTWALRATAAALLALLVPTSWALYNGAEDRTVEPLFWLVLGSAVGMTVASRRQYVEAVQERARAAEQSRDEEAARRVAEERLRIARELHDVIAHHISLINVQAAVAGHLLREDPTGAEEALCHVRGAARSVLDELGMVLAVLRQRPEDGATLTPSPGLGQIPALIEALQGQGHRVSLDVVGGPVQVSGSVELVAYRIVQEALTNVHKHARGGPARVRLSWASRVLTITVENGTSGAEAPRTVSGSGFGLTGMRERVTAIGGTLTTEPVRAGGYLVRAELPIEGGRG